MQGHITVPCSIVRGAERAHVRCATTVVLQTRAGTADTRAVEGVRKATPQRIVQRIGHFRCTVLFAAVYVNQTGLSSGAQRARRGPRSRG